VTDNHDDNGPTEDARLRALLASPRPPADLGARIRANLATPRTAPTARRRRIRALAVLGLALLGAALWFAPLGRTPDVIAAAYDDMRKDRDLRGAHNGDPTRWLATKAVHVPAEMRLDLSKDCALDGIVARHLRLVDANLGRVNFFIYEPAPAGTRVAPASGAVADQYWLLAEPRPGVVVVVLYDAADKRESVARLVARMFAAAISV